MRKKNIHPEALRELEASAHWYDDRRSGLGSELVIDVKQARLLVRHSPESWSPHIYGTRRYVLQRFPFSIIYRIRPAKIQIVAVAHYSRRPGYRKNRRFNYNL